MSRLETSVFALVIVMALAGCGRARNAVPRGDVLRYPLDAEPSSLDPVTITDVTTLELLQNIYEGLVRFDADNRIVPCLAERWEISADGKTYTFHLRASAKFHNGRPMTADDVKYSFERALWPETRSPVAAHYLAGIVGVDAVAAGARRDLAGVRVLDPHTIAITLKRPRGYFLGELAYNTAWVYCREAIERSGGHIDEQAAIGTGPFKLAEYRHGAKVVLDANPDYWGGRPRLARIERPIVIDPQVAHIKYENDEIDACVVSLSDYVNDLKNPALKADCRLMPLADVQYLAMGELDLPAFRDRRVRMAFARAIDRDEISRVAYHGLCPRADSLLPPGLPGCDPYIPRIPYDPASARRLLAEAGYGGGKGFPPLVLVFVQKDPQLTAVAAIIREDLQTNLGISVTLQERESATFYADARAKKLPFHLNGWVADYLDPQNFLPTLLHTGAAVNRVSYSSAAFDSLCDRAEEERDPARRLALYRQADRLAMDDVPLLPLVYYRRPVLVKPYVHDFRGCLMNFLPHRTTWIERRP